MRETTSALRRTCKKCGREMQPFETAYFRNDGVSGGPFCGTCQRDIMRFKAGLHNEGPDIHSILRAQQGRPPDTPVDASLFWEIWLILCIWAWGMGHTYGEVIASWIQSN